MNQATPISLSTPIKVPKVFGAEAAEKLCDKHFLEPPTINLDDKSYTSKVFLINTADEQTDFQDVVKFSLMMPLTGDVYDTDNGFSCSFVLQATLRFLDPTEDMLQLF